MKFKRTLLFLILSISSYTLFAQSADDIINDYFTAIGGRDKIGQINSVHMTGTFSVMGNDGDEDVTILNGKGFKSVVSFNGQNVEQAVTDSGGWMINPFMGSSDPVALPHDQYAAVKDQIYVGGVLYNYKNTGSQVQYEGMDNVDGKSAYKIQATSPDSVKTTFYIDSSTHYLTQLVREFQGQATTAKYSDFRKTDFGNIMPYAEELTLPQGMQANSTINKVEINVPVDASVFAMPKK
ncbi:MAG TPA: hypothetical protein VHB70_17475 [Parafilimonas sp.]|nr:hypothetical protein [Parafilimonas sp.]